jgi:hypothetical protein
MANPEGHPTLLVSDIEPLFAAIPELAGEERQSKAKPDDTRVQSSNGLHACKCASRQTAPTRRDSSRPALNQHAIDVPIRAATRAALVESTPDFRAF